MAQTEESTNSTSTYYLKRNQQASARLTKQHYLIESHLGYTVHPVVFEEVLLKSDGTEKNVIDIACGNG